MLASCVQKRQRAFSMSLFIVLLSVFINITNALVWKIKTNPVVFGGDVELHCSGDSVICRRFCIKRWNGGSLGALIAFDNNTLDSSKYKAVIEQDSYNLIIKNFSRNDVNVTYGCAIGFKSYKRHLGMDANFEYHPTNNAIKAKYDIDENSTLILGVEFQEVHPTPNCSVLFNGRNLTSKLKVNVQESHVFKKVLVRLRHKLDHTCIAGELHMDCYIGKKHFGIIKTYISNKYNSNGFNKEDASRWHIVGYLCVAGIMLLF